jgi:peptidoglycan/LPS O-acetylase OafA/YrhL
MINHSFPIFGYAFLGPNIAVRSFFIVSGFYMGLILNEKYIKKNGSYWLFLSNRLLRIYPLYLLALFFISLFTIYWLQTGQDRYFVLFLDSLQGLPLSTQIFLSVDAFIRNLTLIITTQFATNNNALLVNQGWTLQLEVLFYLLAPFIARRSMVLVGVLLLSLTLRHLFSNQIVDPGHSVVHIQSMLYGFIQNNVYFLLGIFAYKLYAYVKNFSYSPRFLVSIYFSFVALTLYYPYLLTTADPAHPYARDWLYYFLFSMILPFLFIFTKKSKLDNFIGNLSYPFYIIHYLILEILVFIFGMNEHSVVWTLTGFVFSILASLLLLKIVKPIERYREQRVISKKKLQKKYGNN